MEDLDASASGKKAKRVFLKRGEGVAKRLVGSQVAHAQRLAKLTGGEDESGDQGNFSSASSRAPSRRDTGKFADQGPEVKVLVPPAKPPAPKLKPAASAAWEPSFRDDAGDELSAETTLVGLNGGCGQLHGERKAWGGKHLQLKAHMFQSTRCLTCSQALEGTSQAETLACQLQGV